MSNVEEQFPRGGKIPKRAIKRSREADSLFFVDKTPKHMKPKKSRKSGKKWSKESLDPIFKFQGSLSYNKIQDGMIILGCIRQITNLSIEVELPGLTYAYVNITEISDPFVTHLNNQLVNNDAESDSILSKMFTIGQFLPVKITNIDNNEKVTRIEGTINPKHINDGKHHSSFQKGTLIWACMKSVLDHGYEMDVGVKNCRAFLPFKNVDVGRELAIGEPLWCTVHRSDSTNAVTTLRVSIKDNHIKSTTIEEIDNLDHLIPGMQVEFISDKITSSGIQGKFLNDYIGHIDEVHLNNPLKTLHDYQEGKLMKAYVLYMEPLIKVTHLSMRNMDTVPPPARNIGDILSAEVTSKIRNGIYLTSSSEKCFVSNKRLINSLPKKPSIDILDSINIKFPIGSKHTCRILDYSHMSRVYICTVEQSLIKEKIFNSKDVSSGQLINVTIESIKPEGLVVTSGRIRGFVPNLYISNVLYSDKIKKKFKEGQKINARILHVEDNIVMTLKANQVESDKCLTDLNQAKRGDRFPGVIVSTKDHGALVVFYNHVKGWINKQYLGDVDASNADATKYFYLGQVVEPWVLGVKREKVILSLRQPSEFQTVENLRIGQKIEGIVGKIHKDKLDVRNKKGKFIGTIPINHLSCSLSLCSTFLNTFKKGDKINDIICINNNIKPCSLSRREALALKRSPRFKIRKFENIKAGNLIRCSYVSSCNSGIYVLPLISDYTEKILIKTEDIAEKGVIIPNFKPDQSLVAKVVSIDHVSKQIRITSKFREVFDNSVEAVIGYFSEFLADFNYLKNFGKVHDWGLCQYEPGEKVLCKIVQLGEEGGCLIHLPNKIPGLVAARLCPDVEPGQTVKGVFLSQDFKDNYTEICLKPDICQKINNVQDGVINCSNLSSCIAENLLIKSDHVLAVLKRNCNRQLVYIPLYFHENDFEGTDTHYKLNKFKVCVCGKVNDCLIGFSKKLFLRLDKNRLHNNKKIKPVKTLNVLSSEVQESFNGFSKVNTEEENGVNDSDSFSSSDEEHDEVMDIDENHSENSNSENEVEESTAEVELEISHKVCHNSVGKLNNNSQRNSPILSGITSFFNSHTKVSDESSSDEEQEQATVIKKKKLTPAERAELARLEEERITKIEKELADSTKTPESAEQFDRLLLANPNSSELWTKYMAFHIAATEFDKARTVAKRALESINMTLTEERLNIWIALLNLENMFGTKESFEKTFEDAARYNDSLEIYLQTIQMLAEAGKVNEMEEKIKKVKKKFKPHLKMWLEVAKSYYLLNKFREARNMREASLKSIQDKKSQVELIIRFAIMEFKYGEEDQAAAVFETVLSTDPKKVSVWNTYVDQLVKKNKIEQARKVLERAVAQKLPIKSMKSLFLKFRMFEEQYGTASAVESVKENAKEYFANISKKL